jgi:hypothetical protein
VRGTLDFDPAECDYGPASSAIRQLITEWAAVDWFVPAENGADAVATQLFDEHNALARPHLPAAFPENIERLALHSGWASFAALCDRVRAPGVTWDWKYGALKKLSSEHSTRLGWRLSEQAQVPDGEPLKGPAPGALFFRFGETVIWNQVSPKLELPATLAPEHRELAGWYHGYATMDLTEAVEWQLAEKSTSLEENPFLPLLRCYAAGFYPFCLGPSSFVLFAFDAPSAVPPSGSS